MSRHRNSLFFLACLSLLVSMPCRAADIIAPLPQPQSMETTGEDIILAASGAPLFIEWPDQPCGAVWQAEILLQRRLETLHSFPARTLRTPAIQIKITPNSTAIRHLDLNPDQRSQAYTIRTQDKTRGNPSVRIEATTPLGAYYGVNTLCQLLSNNERNELVLPEVRIDDFPTISFRLGKSSASHCQSDAINALADWLSRMKVNYIGLQYHGDNSKDPEPPFEENVSTVCSRLRHEGIVKSIVYFCPFKTAYFEHEYQRGWYNFLVKGDPERYQDYVRWIMAQGADGIEVDYNDWPGRREVPIEDVINLAWKAAREVNPDARVLYCPPGHGQQSYRGPASATLARTLRNSPSPVSALWTGKRTDDLYANPMTDTDFKQWIDTTGEKPIFWQNRAGLSVKKAFVTETSDGTMVYRSNQFPPDFADLVDGVHLNLQIPNLYEAATGGYADVDLIYLASVADFLWNPDQWDTEGTAKRAKAFVAKMRSLQ